MDEDVEEIYYQPTGFLNTSAVEGQQATLTQSPRMDII